MAAPKTLRPAFAGTPGPSPRVIRKVAGEAGAAADASEPKEAPKRLPQHTYALDRTRRVALIDERTKSLEEQRFNAELDWDGFIAQLEAMLADGEATELEMESVRNAERQTRIRVISLDAALARMQKRKV